MRYRELEGVALAATNEGDAFERAFVAYDALFAWAKDMKVRQTTQSESASLGIVGL